MDRPQSVWFILPRAVVPAGPPLPLCLGAVRWPSLGPTTKLHDHEGPGRSLSVLLFCLCCETALQFWGQSQPTAVGWISTSTPVGALWWTQSLTPDKARWSFLLFI